MKPKKKKPGPTWAPNFETDPMYPFPKVEPALPDTTQKRIKPKRSWGQIKDRYRKEPEY